jgi:hypothetical protein
LQYIRCSVGSDGVKKLTQSPKLSPELVRTLRNLIKTALEV